MKKVYVLLLLFFSLTINSNAQFWSTFNEGTLEGFTNSDGSIDLLSVEQENETYYLQKICDGSDTAVGEMMLINVEDWVGNYFYNPTGGEEVMRGLDEIFMRNDNDFDIHLRYGFTGSNGYQVVTTTPIVIPAQSNWDVYTQSFYLYFPTIENLTIINDVEGIPYLEVFNHIHDLFEDVIEIRIFHNEEVSFEPQIVTGSLQIDEIWSYELLNASENSISNLRLYPNPFSSELNIQWSNIIDVEAIIFTILGNVVRRETKHDISTSLDLSDLESGMYLVKISSETETITKKVIKH